MQHLARTRLMVLNLNQTEIEAIVTFFQKSGFVEGNPEIHKTS